MTAERKALRPIVEQIRSIHSYTQGLILSILVGDWVVDYPVTRKGKNPWVLKAKLYYEEEG